MNGPHLSPVEPSLFEEAALIPADEHDYNIDTAGTPGIYRACLRCRTCAARNDGWAIFYGHTLNLAIKAHRQHVAATDLAQNGRSTC